MARTGRIGSCSEADLRHPADISTASKQTHTADDCAFIAPISFQYSRLTLLTGPATKPGLRRTAFDITSTMTLRDVVDTEDSGALANSSHRLHSRANGWTHEATIGVQKHLRRNLFTDVYHTAPRARRKWGDDGISKVLESPVLRRVSPYPSIPIKCKLRKSLPLNELLSSVFR
jgi:hypothetical protein